MGQLGFWVKNVTSKATLKASIVDNIIVHISGGPPPAAVVSQIGADWTLRLWQEKESELIVTYATELSGTNFCYFFKKKKTKSMLTITGGGEDKVVGSQIFSFP